MIGRCLKAVLGLVGFVILILVVCLVFADAIARRLLESAIRARTGMDASIQRVEMGLLRPTLRVEGLKIHSPASYGGMPMLDLRELFVEYDRAAAQRREIVLKLVRIDIEEVNLITDVSGRTNAFEFPGIPEALSGMTNRIAAGTGFREIETLNFSLGTLRRTNLKNPSESSEWPVHVRNEVVTRVRTAGDLLPLVFKIATRVSGAGVIDVPRTGGPPAPRPSPPPGRRLVPAPGAPPGSGPKSRP